MPPRRVREDRLVLEPIGNGPERLLAQRQEWSATPGAEPTQRRYLVSPDGEWLAFADPTSGALHLVGPGGREIVIGDVRGRDVRFSPDGRSAAIVTGSGERDTVALVDLASGAQRSLGALTQVHWIEWTAAGVVVQHFSAVERSEMLTLLPLHGAPRDLAMETAGIRRFVAAARATRVVYFSANGIFQLDAAHPERPPQVIGNGRLGGGVQNAEASPDGTRVAFVAMDGLYEMEGANAPERIDAQPGIHTVWYSADGAFLAWASPRGATVRGLGASHTLAAPAGDLRALRFARLGGGLVVARGAELLAWNPLTGVSETLGRARAGELVFGGDRFAGGVVLWTSKPLAGMPVLSQAAHPQAAARTQAANAPIHGELD